MKSILVLWLFTTSFGFAQFLVAQQATVNVITLLDEGNEFIIDRPQDASVNDRGVIAIAEIRQAKILVFDANGEYLRTIGRRGNGPGEFQMIYNIELIGNDLYTLDFQLQRVSKFDVTTGTVLKTMSFKDLFGNLMPSNTSVITDESGKQHLVVSCTDYNSTIGSGNLFKLIVVDNDLTPSERLSVSFETKHLIAGREAYNMSIFLPVSNYSLISNINYSLFALYHFDTQLLRIDKRMKPISVKKINTSTPTTKVKEKISNDRNDIDTYINGRNIISVGGSSPTGSQAFAVVKHSLLLFLYQDSIVHLISLYDEIQDRYIAMYSKLDNTGQKEIAFGRIQVVGKSNSVSKYEIRKVFAINKNGVGLVYFLDSNREYKLAIVHIEHI